MNKCKKCGKEYSDIGDTEIIMCEECSDFIRHYGERDRIVKPYGKICGKRRRLRRGMPPMFFLVDRKDVEELGIGDGLTPSEWINDTDGFIKKHKAKMMADNKIKMETLELFDKTINTIYGKEGK